MIFIFKRCNLFKLYKNHCQKCQISQGGVATPLDTASELLSIRDTKSAHTHTLISDLFGVVNLCSLRGEGRRGREGRVKNGVRMKHMITLE